MPLGLKVGDRAFGEDTMENTAVFKKIAASG